MDEIRDNEKRTELLRSENEELDQELTREQKKALIREAKAMYGNDWRKVVGAAGKWLTSRRIDKEALFNLHSMGMGGDDLRSYNDPRSFRRR